MNRVAAVLVAAAVMTGIPGSAAAAADSQRALLERHRPVLVYDRAERWRATGVDEFVADGLPRLSATPTSPSARDVVYGRVARDGGHRWLQYWLFFAYNGQDRGIVRTGRHEGDWELFQLRLAADGEPDAATFTQHSSAAACRWDQLERDAATTARIYVGNGSHALYPRRGVHDRPFPDPNDEARGDETALPQIRVVTAASPNWMRWDGRWGESRAGLVPGEQSSPHGPAHAGERWADPARLHVEARACLTAPGGARWVSPALGAAGAALGLALALVLRRRRRIRADRS